MSACCPDVDADISIRGDFHLNRSTAGGVKRKGLERRIVAYGDFRLARQPRVVERQHDAALDRLVRSSGQLQLSRREVLETLQPWREVDFLEGGKKRTWNLLHQLRQDGENRWLFIAQAYNDMRARQEEVWYRRPLHDPQWMEIRVRGCWRPEIYDTLTGKTEAAGAAYRDGWTVLDRDLYGNDSLLLRLCPAKPDSLGRNAEAGASQVLRKEPLPEPFAYEMSEPNALILDRFEYALDDEDWQPAEEMWIQSPCPTSTKRTAACPSNSSMVGVRVPVMRRAL